ncbi:MAG: hypothetical protein ACYCVH_10695 [Ignavibacteriaceae bacterium]
MKVTNVIEKGISFNRSFWFGVGVGAAAVMIVLAVVGGLLWEKRKRGEKVKAEVKKILASVRMAAWEILNGCSEGSLVGNYECPKDSSEKTD